jgi:hypothetical protein
MWPDPSSSQRLDEITVRALALAQGNATWNQVVLAATRCKADMPHGTHAAASMAKRATDVAIAHTRIMLANPVFADVFDPLNHGGGGGGGRKKKPKKKNG